MTVNKCKVVGISIIILYIVLGICVVFNIEDVFGVSEDNNEGTSVAEYYIEEAERLTDEAIESCDTYYLSVLLDGPENEDYSEAIEWFEYEGYTEEEINEGIYEIKKYENESSF